MGYGKTIQGRGDSWYENNVIERSLKRHSEVTLKQTDKRWKGKIDVCLDKELRSITQKTSEQGKYMDNKAIRMLVPTRRINQS